MNVRRTVGLILTPVLLVLLTGADEIETPYDAAAFAKQAYSEGRYKEAADSYELALVDLPEAPELHFGHGNALFKLHDMEQAMAAYLRVLETDDNDLAAKAYYNLGNVHYRISLNAMSTFRDAVTPLRKAMQHYRDALGLAPDLADAMYNLELADRLMDDLAEQRAQAIIHPEAEQAAKPQNPDLAIEQATEGQRPPDTETESEAQAGSQTGDAQQGPQGAESEQDAQTQSAGNQRELTAEEAEEMVEMVRSRNQAAEELRQQWRQARMRDAGIEKPW
jgi:tetratricopeptide (TPR) repeat protein